MKCNVGNTDKITRWTIAIILVILGYYLSISWLYYIALIPAITAFTGYCALYSLFGINTCNN